LRQSTTCGIDFKREAEPNELNQSNLQYSDEIVALSDCNVFIITVPTPIDQYKRSDLRNTRVIDLIKGLQNSNTINTFAKAKL